MEIANNINVVIIVLGFITSIIVITQYLKASTRQIIKIELADIKSEITDIRVEIADIRVEIANIRIEIADIRAEIKVINNRLNLIERDIDALRFAITNLTNERVNDYKDIVKDFYTRTYNPSKQQSFIVE